MVIAVTGAIGYPGSHMSLCLEEAQENYLPFDSHNMLQLKQQQTDALILHQLDDAASLAELFLKHEITEVIHFAGGGFVPHSIDDPLTYYRDNTLTAYILMSACMLAGINRLVLSSTASVYGIPERMPIREDTTLNPITPFGSSMAMAERIAKDTATANDIDIDIAILRYFNLAGADAQNRAGELGRPRHLIKVVAQIAVGSRQEKLQIYGDDYDTPDGTCVRDYVHVSDMADAHLAALRHLRQRGGSLTLNCGYGYGVSVREVIEAAEKVSGKKIETEIAPRRQGDPPLLIADTAEIRTVLDWSPKYDDLNSILETAIAWEQFCKENSV